MTAMTQRIAAGSGAALWLLASPAYACPMCFGGNNESAFLYGSLFLMVVPVTAIGSLLYWAYRRTRAIENDPLPRPPAPRAAEPATPARAPALRLVRANKS